MSRCKGSEGMKAVEDLSKDSKPEPGHVPAKKSTRRKKRSMVIHDSLSAPKPKPASSKLKLKGVQKLTPEEHKATDTMQAIKNSRKTLKVHLLPAKMKTLTPNEDSEHLEEYQPKLDDEIQVHKNVDEVMKDADAIELGKEEGEMNDVEKDATKQDKDVDDLAMNVETAAQEIQMTTTSVTLKESSVIAPESSTQSVSSGFTNQFFNFPSDVNLTGIVKESANADISSLMDVPIQHATPQLQSLSLFRVPISIILKTSTLPPIPKVLTKTPVTTIPPPHLVTTTPVVLRVAELENEVSEIKKSDHYSKALAALKSHVPKDKNAMDKVVADIVKDHKRRHNDDEGDADEGPSAGSNRSKSTKKRRTKEPEPSKKTSTTKETPKGKAPAKCSKTGKSASTKEPIEEP
ncbi:hypothetical protein Tco_1337908, partial [Tanacetum coccineum]